MKVMETYPGGKSGAGTYQKIINEIRPHQVYVEPFLGGGGVLLNKKPAWFTLGSDVDPEVIKKWYQMDVSKYPNLRILRRDALDFLFEFFEQNSQKDTVIYLDPPYPMSSRKSDKDLYRFELSDEYHRKLLTYVRTLTCDVLISTYPNALYAEMLAGWRCVSFTVATRRGPALEYLYMNYDNPAGVLHEYTYLGGDFREREMIKKGVTGFIKRLRKKPIAEQMAYISAVMGFNEEMGYGVSRETARDPIEKKSMLQQ